MRQAAWVAWAAVVVGCGGAGVNAGASARAGASASAGAGADADAGVEPTVLSEGEKKRDAELAVLAERALSAPAIANGMLARSGAVYFVSNADGLPQLYAGDAASPKGAARRLPTPRERVLGATLTGDEKAILFLDDRGGDGNFHVSRVGVDGGGLADLTPEGTLHRDHPIAARGVPDLFAYSAHATTDERTTVYLQTIGGAPRAIHVDPRGGALADLAPDGKRALFVEFLSSSEQVLFEIDAAGGGARRVFPPEGEKARVDGSFAAQGDRVYALTQSAGRPAAMVAIDRAGRTVARYEEKALPDASLDGLLVSPTGDRVVVSVDAGNHTEVRVLDASTLAVQRSIPVAPSLVQLGAFAADGARFTAMISRPDAPPSVYAVDARTGAVTALREPEAASTEPIASSIVSVPSFDGLAIPTNLYLPPGAATDGKKRPTLVLIHGGPSGSAYLRWDPDVRFFASLGYAIVQPNIRGSTGFGVAYEEADDREKRGDAVKDVAAIHDWARAQPWCDGDRMVIMGQSYGGYMTLVALTRQPAMWSAGVERSGMSDLRTMEALEDQAIRVYDETEFGKVGRDDATLLEWSPLKDVDRVTAPLFVYQGVNDPVTPQREADQIVRALRARGVPVEYMRSPDEGHGIVRKANRVEFLARAARFLEEHARR